MNENKFSIKKIKAREILDSRGNPTIETEIYTTDGIIGRAAVPSGASTGIHEAVEIRDNDPKRYFGKGVLKAVKNVETKIFPNLKGFSVLDQIKIDRIMIELDGTKNKSNLGANAILSVSLAVARAAANSLRIPLFSYISKYLCNNFKNLPCSPILPYPLMNILNGGKHAGNELSIQEFMIIPRVRDSFNESLRASVEIYHTLKKYLKKKYGPSAINVGDEGGFAPPFKLTSDALDALVISIEEAGYSAGKEVLLAIDAAASVFFDEKTKVYHIDGVTMSVEELMDYYLELTKKYPLRSIEDPFYEEDFEAFSEFTKRVGSRIQIVGDDLFVTNKERLEHGISLNSANALLLKVNQIGTLTEALDAADVAVKNNYAVIVSHRSGETEDPFISDLAVGMGVGQIKAGAPCRSDRNAKYNQLLRIAEYNISFASTSSLPFLSKLKL
ncbi:MAG: phosphopyruvate hydratase [Candidatus Asgardarchaeia archaeon]